jgi:CheY-like chemotaxis protein
MSGPRILFVDDDRDLVAALRLVLEGGGYTVGVAHNAEDGLSKAMLERPDLILLDVMMPNATEGFHFVWRLRDLGDDYFKRVPIIVLSAIHDRTTLRFYPDAPDGTYAAGEFLPVQEFLDKPVEPAVLLERIGKILAIAKRG